jgi:hypothetical protein
MTIVDGPSTPDKGAFDDAPLYYTYAMLTSEISEEAARAVLAGENVVERAEAVERLELYRRRRGGAL